MTDQTDETDQSTLHYTAEHEWVRVDGDTATVGITAYAAEKLGDVVFVELPAIGTAVVAGSIVGEIESTKSVGELYAPISGTITATNDAVVDSPELVNSDPFGAGWLVRLTFAELPTLLNHAEYAALTGAQSGE
jgi:glycine cleavage system H protein